MERFFNNAGPTVPADHYHIDPLSRVDWEEIEHLIAQKRYFVLHAPRQTGKTTTLLAMMQALNEEGRYACAYANIEGAQAARGDESKGIPAVCSAIAGALRLYLHDTRLVEWFAQYRNQPAEDQLKQLLEYWTVVSDKPTVLFLDEVDALVGDTLISLLRQIRAGYAQRPAAFPQSIILCGVRDVRDYRLHQDGAEVITGGSAFNIKAKSLRMGNFTYAECEQLWLQHTEETGQPLDPAIFPELWEDTRGQPWLVNALGYELTWEFKPARERSRPLTLEDYRAARERLIQSRATHLDQLTDKLREPRVQRVMSALLSSEESLDIDAIKPDDQQYVEDLGLIETRPSLRISNRIYREVIPRDLTWIMQTRIPNQEQAWYLRPDHRLDTPKLLAAFQQFFREHAESWLERFQYKEAGPQLVMQAFLQRIINGGGRITREYGLGRKRTDLFIEWPLDIVQGFNGPVQRVVIELKLQHQSREATIAKGLEQTADYADQVGADEAHLVVFNRDEQVAWEDKIWQDEAVYGEWVIHTWGA
ncbi:AAA family ATPase [Vreelandella massiliensis]|uniref:AAA family ATPase n=1 Tax=Vreelandella massiliensis TaxID=1816686 RepID=UPI00096A78DB|nr:AAA family ATPase [Halomonas massiliensis]